MGCSQAKCLNACGLPPSSLCGLQWVEGLSWVIFSQTAAVLQLRRRAEEEQDALWEQAGMQRVPLTGMVAGRGVQNKAEKYSWCFALCIVFSDGRHDVFISDCSISLGALLGLQGDEHKWWEHRAEGEVRTGLPGNGRNGPQQNALGIEVVLFFFFLFNLSSGCFGESLQRSYRAAS